LNELLLRFASVRRLCEQLFFRQVHLQGSPSPVRRYPHSEPGWLAVGQDYSGCAPEHEPLRPYSVTERGGEPFSRVRCGAQSEPGDPAPRFGSRAFRHARVLEQPGQCIRRRGQVPQVEAPRRMGFPASLRSSSHVSPTKFEVSTCVRECRRSSGYCAVKSCRRFIFKAMSV